MDRTRQLAEAKRRKEKVKMKSLRNRWLWIVAAVIVAAGSLWVGRAMAQGVRYWGGTRYEYLVVRWGADYGYPIYSQEGRQVEGAEAQESKQPQMEEEEAGKQPEYQGEGKQQPQVVRGRYGRRPFPDEAYDLEWRMDMLGRYGWRLAEVVPLRGDDAEYVFMREMR